MQKSLSIDKLNDIYNKAESCDKAIFSEQRSNVLLAAGEHYAKKNSNFWNRVRDTVSLPEDQRLRLTKNHIHRICNIYINNIYSLAPGVGITPKNEKEIQDQKAAELNNAVWEHIKQKQQIRQKVRKLVDHFVKLGEVAAKIYWDANAGKVIGYRPLIDEETKQPVIDEMTGQMVPSEEPVMSGELCIEPILGFDLLREQSSKNMKDGIVIYRKMVNKKDLEKQYKDDEEKLKFIESDGKETFTVFDGSSGSYDNSKEEVLVREFYQPPCYEYKNGYFWMATQKGVLEEGELPFGIFPIVFSAFDEIPTSPRGRSIIKQARPYQAEINRTASAIATAQITLGDDKLLTMAGSKVTQGAKLPGARVMNYTGAAPTILPGRSGEQYLPYLDSQIKEMYLAVNLAEEVEEKANQSQDPYAELFKAMRHKKKYSLYAEKFEWFLVDMASVALEVTRKYISDEELIPMIGRSEAVNISEFKNTTPLQFSIKLEPQLDDYETKMGKQLTVNTILQYVGSNLGKDDIGKLIRVAPYVNKEESFGDFTIDYDNATNVILALDRGEYPEINFYDDPKYMGKKLTHRMRKSDFKFLAPQIQEAYKQKTQEYEALEVEQLKALKAAESEFIPGSGPLVKVDMYIEDPMSPGKTTRAQFPSDSLTWLKKMLEKQGLAQDDLSKLYQGQQADIAKQFLNRVGAMAGNDPMVGSSGMPMDNQPMY